MGFDLGSLGNVGGVGSMGGLMDVWNKIQTKDWGGLFKAIQDLRSEKGDSQGLQQVEGAAKKTQADGEPFPHDPSQLASLLTSKM